ncbi:MAG: response regulator [Rubrivivax sp.]|nr:response regulator [Rubrivivax sp.]
MTETTVHVVDDDPSFRTAMSRMLRASGYVVKTYGSAGEFLAERDSDEPGCLVVDLQMPGVGGLDLQSALAQSRAPMPVLFLTGHADTASTVRAMRSGAEDFLEKTDPQDRLLDAIRRALVRDAAERRARVAQRELHGLFDTLTAREREVLGHVLQGRLNKQIAADLGIHERTVKVHRKSLMTKLKVRSVAALTRLAQEAGVDGPAAATFPLGQ